MELLESHLSSIGMTPADLQGVSPSHRIYTCFACRVPVKLCRTCDRGNIYCPDCQLPLKKARISRAQKSYKRSPHGLRKRAAQSKERRLRKLAQLKIEGDRGLPSCSEKIMTPEPATSAESSNHGVTQNVKDSNETGTSQSAKVPTCGRNIPTITCSKCKGLCLDFQRKSPGRFFAQEKERLLKWLSRFRDPVPRAT